MIREYSKKPTSPCSKTSHQTLDFVQTVIQFNSIQLHLGNFRPENEWTRQAHLDSVPKGAGSGNYTDGSIESDLPMQQLSELFNVNHFIVSQVSRG